jgi:hypothetical protein
MIGIRLEVSADHFKWIADLCTVLMIGSAIYLAFHHSADQFVYSLMRYLPMIVSPIFLAQIYSTSDKIDIRTISLISRRFQKNVKPVYVNTEYPFMALVIISASFSPEKNPMFYPLFLPIAAYGFYTVRNRRYSPLIWIGCFMSAAIIGYAASVGLNTLQLFMEKNADWFSDTNFEDTDPFRSITAIRNIGELKASNRILFRVQPEYPQQLPILLRETAYDRFYNNGWFAVSSAFTPIYPSEKNIWSLGPRPKRPRQLRVLSPLKNGKGLLKLPSGVTRILDLPAEEMLKNQFGAVRVRGCPNYAEYRAEYGETDLSEAPPSKGDMQIPEDDILILKEITDELGLRTLLPKGSINRLKAFFETKFTYSLSRKFDKNPVPLSSDFLGLSVDSSNIREKKLHDLNPIHRFLQHTRSGHCEYFATAGVLLLRYVGIPARYAVGFSVHEWSNRENQAIVRTRHAHAWTLAWIDGKWMDADFTPSVWSDSEGEKMSQWHQITDLWDYAVFLFQQWRWQKTDRSVYAFWLIAPLIFILGRRLILLRKTRNVRTKNAHVIALKNHKLSPFDDIADFLQRQGYARLPGETLKTWISRICREHRLPNADAELMSLVNIHYRLRFDPNGITPEEYLSLEKASGQFDNRN